MKTLDTFTILLFFLTLSCAHLPDIYTLDAATATQMDQRCRAVYPTGAWQFLHIIEAKPPGSDTQTLMGLSQISSTAHTAHCVLMTVEGLVLFEAQYDGGALTLQRALPPFDRPGFAEGLIEDLLLIYFAPDWPLAHTGYLEDETPVCRYQAPGKGAQDIMLFENGGWKIARFNIDNKLIREILPDIKSGRNPQGFPVKITLKAPGLMGYRLNLTLVETQPLLTE